jgi:preprotein translocase subunit SecE
MAKTSPGEFIRQTRTEISKIVWPTRKETTQTAIILATFFFSVDALFAFIVRSLLALAQ